VPLLSLADLIPSLVILRRYVHIPHVLALKATVSQLPRNKRKAKIGNQERLRVPIGRKMLRSKQSMWGRSFEQDAVQPTELQSA
jgi:hypothetical protein